MFKGIFVMRFWLRQKLKESQLVSVRLSVPSVTCCLSQKEGFVLRPVTLGLDEVHIEVLFIIRKK